MKTLLFYFLSICSSNLREIVYTTKKVKLCGRNLERKKVNSLSMRENFDQTFWSRGKIRIGKELSSSACSFFNNH